MSSCCPGLEEVSLANAHLLNIQDFYPLVHLGMPAFIADNSRVSDPHPFHADLDPDPRFQIFANPDPRFEIFADLLQSLIFSNN